MNKTNFKLIDEQIKHTVCSANGASRGFGYSAWTNRLKYNRNDRVRKEIAAEGVAAAKNTGCGRSFRKISGTWRDKSGGKEGRQAEAEGGEAEMGAGEGE